MPDPFATLLRRLALWTLICCVSAAPSFYWADHNGTNGARFDRSAMVVGVALFIVAYTALTSTTAFERFHNRPFVRRTLYIGYGVRLALSLAFPIGMGADLFPGLLSVSLVEKSGLRPYSFEGTLATTVVQGAILNVLVFLFMLLVYGIQRLTMKPPPVTAPRGFDVVLPPPPEQAAGAAQRV